MRVCHVKSPGHRYRPHDGALSSDRCRRLPQRTGSLQYAQPIRGHRITVELSSTGYGRLFQHTRKAGVGVIGIRVLAGGALSGSTERHPIASPPPEPIGSAMSYDADVLRARRLMPLVKEGFASTLTEVATRFTLAHPAIGTILVGMATPQQFEDTLAAVQKGALPPAALQRLTTLWQGFAGEPRRSTETVDREVTASSNVCFWG